MAIRGRDAREAQDLYGEAPPEDRRESLIAVLLRTPAIRTALVTLLLGGGAAGGAMYAAGRAPEGADVVATSPRFVAVETRLGLVEGELQKANGKLDRVLDELAEMRGRAKAEDRRR